MGKTRIGLIGVALSSCANGATVTYTLSLNENVSGACQANRFAVYATVSQGDNSGLFAFGLDLRSRTEGGAGILSPMTNRTPGATFVVDSSDPNYDPDVSYPIKSIGFLAGRGANFQTGIFSGVQDLAQEENLIPVFGFGQQAGDLNSFYPEPFINPPESAHPGAAVAWKMLPVAGSDVAYGGDRPGLPSGTIRLGTAVWNTTDVPKYQIGSVNNKASVWTLNTTTRRNEVVFPQLRYRDICNPLPLSAALSASTPAGSENLASGGAIVVSGSNYSYLSEVDPLLDPPSNKGSVVIQGIGDEAGNLYVMAKLNGTPGDIADLLSSMTEDVDLSDPRFLNLHQVYDPRFGAASFNALFEIPNAAGPKVFSWDFTPFPGITMDQLAVTLLPEPSTTCALLGCSLAILRRRRQARV